MRIRLPYSGPGAWLIRLNLLIACLTLVPLLIEFGMWLLAVSKVSGGGIIIAVGLMVLWVYGQFGYVACAPTLILTCVLLLTPKIPWKVKLITAAVGLTSCAVLFWDVRRLGGQLNHGILGSSR